MNENIVIVGPSKYFLSGISYYTIRLAEALSRDYEVSVIGLRKLLPRFLFPGKSRVGKHISDLDFPRDIEVIDNVDYNNPFSWFKASSFIEMKRPQYIILQWWTSSVAHMLTVLGKAGKKVKSKVVFELHEIADPIENGNVMLRLYSQVFGKLLFSMANHFVTHSESDKNNASSVYGIEKENISVIPLALFDHHNINTNIISARKKIGLENKFVILSFGLIRDYKGIPYLIKAFNTLPEEIAKESILLIVGEIWESRDAINKVIKTSRYSKKIRLIDRYIPDDEVTTYFSASDVVCLPYLRASQSAVAHTAAAFCKPIIVSSVGGLKESMANYEGTTFVPPGNSDAIASQIVNSFTLWKSGEPVNYSPLKQNWVKTLESYKKIFYQENAS